MNLLLTFLIYKWRSTELLFQRGLAMLENPPDTKPATLRTAEALIRTANKIGQELLKECKTREIDPQTLVVPPPALLPAPRSFQESPAASPVAAKTAAPSTPAPSSPFKPVAYVPPKQAAKPAMPVPTPVYLEQKASDPLPPEQLEKFTETLQKHLSDVEMNGVCDAMSLPRGMGTPFQRMVEGVTQRQALANTDHSWRVVNRLIFQRFGPERYEKICGEFE